jgi:hypothetical protein
MKKSISAVLVLLAVMIGISLVWADDPEHALAQQARPALDTEVTLNPVADTYVWLAYPDTNFGADTTLVAGECVPCIVSGRKRILLRFDLTGLPPHASISQATLRLYQESEGVGSVDLSVRRVIHSWQELSATWNDRPLITNDSFASTACGTEAGWRTWDVTSLVQLWQDGSYPNYGFGLKGPEGGDWSNPNIWGRTFTSREGNANRPQLVVNYTTCPEPPILYPISNPDCDGDYTVSWSSVNGFYIIQEDDNPSFSSPEEYGIEQGEQFHATGKSPGTYYYRVRLYGCSDWSNTESVQVCSLTPPTLYPISNSDCDGDYTVSWSSVGGAAYYVLEEDDNPSFSSPTTVYQGPNTSKNIVGKSPGTYYYRVRACNADGCSDWSNVESVKVWPIPAAPTLDPISNDEPCDGDYTVSWSSVANATSYELQEDDDSSFSSPTTVYSGSSTSTEITGRSGGMWYYRVRACNCRGCGDWSNTESVYVLDAPILDPIDNDDCNGRYPVSWSSVADATRYELQEDDDPAFSSPTTVYEGSSTSKYAIGRSPGTYYYRVRASNALCYSAWSDTQSVTVWPLLDVPPTLDPISNDEPCDGDYTVSWSAIADATSYELQEDLDPSFSDPTTVYQGPDPSTDITGQVGGTFYYRVRASNCRDTTGWSNTQSVYVLDAPTAQSIANPDCDGNYGVSWSAVADATSYELEEDDDPSFSSPATVYQGSSTSVYISDNSPATYSYHVRASNELCYSGWSNTQSVKVWLIPEAPTLDPISNEDFDGAYTVSWSSVPDGTTYELREDDNDGFSSPATVYSGPSTSTEITCHAGGTWYYQVRACNCRDCGDWSNVESVASPEPPTITGVEASIDGIPDGGIGYFISLPAAGTPVWNTFTAYVQPSGDPVETVQFSLNGQTHVDDTPGDGWTAQFDMSELPAGNATLQVIAYDTGGLCSPPEEITIYTIVPPPWYGQSWVLNPQVTWSETQRKYTFEGRVPNNPRLYYQKDFDVPYLGSLRNVFESDIVVTEEFGIDGEWEYQARGVLKAEILNIPALDKEYPARPVFSGQAGMAEYGLQGYEWSTSLPVRGKSIPVIKDETVATFAIGPVIFRMLLSVDVGFNGSLTIQGRLLNDLSADEIRITPGISPYMEVDIGLEILLGLAKVGSRVRPTITFYLPIVYDFTPPAGQDKLYLDDPCVRFRLKVTVYVEVLWGLFGAESDSYTLIDEDWPEGCSEGLPRVVVQVIEPEESPVDLFASPIVASDGQGGAMVVWIADRDDDPETVDPEVFYQVWDGAGWGPKEQLTDNQRFETDPRAVFLSTGEAMAVWTQNELTRAEGEALIDINAALAQQELYYSRWDGTQWSAPGRITNNDLPDGRAALAAGPDGRALLVWLRDGDAHVETRGDWEIYFSQWNGAAWSAPAPVTSDPVAEAAQPDVACDSTGQAFAVWSHDADADLLTVEDRHLAYATWNGAAWSAPTVLSDWPPGALSPEVTFSTADEPLLIFTIREQDAEGQFYGEGLHDLLWSARLTAGGWQLAPIGESTQAIDPQLTINPSNYAIVAFRGFTGQGAEGFGGDIVVATADLSEPTLSWSTPQFLTEDAARDWQVTATVDPVSGHTIIVDVHGGMEEARGVAPLLRGPGTAQALSDDLATLDIPFGKDLSITIADIAFSNSHPQPGDTVMITATVRNLGMQSVGAAERPLVRIYRAAELIGEAVIDTPLLHNEVVEIIVPWIATGGLNEISVVVDPTDVVEELDETNNAATTIIGQVSTPRFLVATAHPEGEAILLDWEPPETNGITGYRIYRSTSPGSGYQAVGDTAESSYVDRGLVVGTTYYYVVTALDSFGVESAYSDEDSAVPMRNPWKIYAGWNLISLPLGPADTAIETVLSSTSGNYDLVYAYDGCDPTDPWKKYDVSAPPYANDLTHLSDKMGFWIRVANTDTLSISREAPTQTDILFCEGWNLVGYPSTKSKSVTEALSSIDGKYTLVYAYDASDLADPWKKYDVSAPPYANDLTEMHPGLGYWIQASEDCVLTVSN